MQNCKNKIYLKSKDVKEIGKFIKNFYDSKNKTFSMNKMIKTKNDIERINLWGTTKDINTKIDIIKTLNDLYTIKPDENGIYAYLIEFDTYCSPIYEFLFSVVYIMNYNINIDYFYYCKDLYYVGYYSLNSKLPPSSNYYEYDSNNFNTNILLEYFLKTIEYGFETKESLIKDIDNYNEEIASVIKNIEEQNDNVIVFITKLQEPKDINEL